MALFVFAFPVQSEGLKGYLGVPQCAPQAAGSDYSLDQAMLTLATWIENDRTAFNFMADQELVASRCI